MKVLLRHQNKTSMDWQQRTDRSNGSIDNDDDDLESMLVKDNQNSEFSTIFNQK